MSVWSDFLGTVSNSFSIGLKRANVKTTNITSERNFELPNANGTFVTSVNSTPPDTTGNVTINVGGSGVDHYTQHIILGIV